MKKTGYTLAEILIAIAVVGVIAGLLLPMVGKIRPDMNKMVFLQTYDSIVQVTRKLAGDERYYPSDAGEFYEKYPLASTSVYMFNGTPYSGWTKYCELLAVGMNGEGEDCKVEPDEVELFKSPATFSTPNGSEFWVKTEFKDADLLSEPPKPGEYKTTIAFDINGAEGKNCEYDESSCLNPDRYTLFVTAAGEVVASDVMSQYYLNNRANYRLNNEKNLIYSRYELTGKDLQLSIVPSDVNLIPDEGNGGNEGNEGNGSNEGNGGNGGNGGNVGNKGNDKEEEKSTGNTGKTGGGSGGGGGRDSLIDDGAGYLCLNSFTAAGTTVSWIGSCKTETADDKHKYFTFANY